MKKLALFLTPLAAIILWSSASSKAIPPPPPAPPADLPKVCPVSLETIEHLQQILSLPKPLSLTA